MRRFKSTRNSAFTLVEVLIVVIILSILAAFVIPQFSNATQLTRENTLRDDLRFLRAQIGVYKAQHEDVCPGYANNDTTTPADSATFNLQMTGFTNRYGVYSATASSAFQFGPYLTRVPVNPITGKTAIAVQAGTADPVPDASLDAGWIYNPQTEQIIANVVGADSNGVSYGSY